MDSKKQSTSTYLAHLGAIMHLIACLLVLFTPFYHSVILPNRFLSGLLPFLGASSWLLLWLFGENKAVRYDEKEIMEMSGFLTYAAFSFSTFDLYS